MKFFEAIELCKEGKHIKRPTWKDEGFLAYFPKESLIAISEDIPKLDSDNFFLVQKIKESFRMNPSIFVSDDWIDKENENEKDPPQFTFPLAIEELKKGKKVKLISWDKFTFLELSSAPQFHFILNSILKNTWFTPSDIDLVSEDWEVLE